MRRTPGLFIRLPELGMPWFPFLCIVFQVSLNWIGHCLLRVRVVSRVAPTVGDHFAVTYGLPWPPIFPLWKMRTIGMRIRVRQHMASYLLRGVNWLEETPSTHLWQHCEPDIAELLLRKGNEYFGCDNCLPSCRVYLARAERH